MVTFLQLPGTTRVPNVYVEVDPNRTQQSPQIQPYRILVIGQRLSAGTAAALSLQEVRSASAARALFGRGSQLAQMLERCLATSGSVPVFGIAVADPAGVAATGTITFTGPATAPGEIDVYVGGRRVPVSVALGDNATTIATNVAAALNANLDLIATAASALGVVTLTCRHLGLLGNEVDVRLSYQFGETLPAGVTAAVVAMSGGTLSPVFSAVWPVIGDEWFNLFAISATDATNLTSVEQEMLSRFGVLREIDGNAIAAKNQDEPTLQTLGLTRNSKHLSIIGLGLAASTPWEIAAQATGRIAVEAQADPTRPFQDLDLPDVLGPARADRFTFAERDELLHSGIATAIVDQVGVVRLERMITTYRLDENGVEDDSFLDLTTLFAVSFIRWDFRTTIRGKFSRFKIGTDGVRYAEGQPVLTPNTGRAEAITKFREWEERGIVEDADQFAADLVVERNSVDKSRMDFFLPANLVNGLNVVGVRLSFLL